MGRIFLVAFVFSLALTTTVFSHSWYDMECCSGRDCAPAKKVETLPGGVLRISITLPKPMSPKETFDITVDVNLETLPKDKIKSSKDENIHLCIDPYNLNPIRILCVYLPAGS